MKNTNLLEPILKMPTDGKRNSYINRLSIIRPNRVGSTKQIASAAAQLEGDYNNKQNEEQTFSGVIESIQIEIENRNPADIYLIMNYMKGTKLMNKFKQDKEISETSYINLMYMCSTYINLLILKKDRILFKIDEVGDKFYILLKGTITVLKPVQNEKVLMNLLEYLDYLLILKEKKEKHILSKTLKENSEVLFIRDITEFEKVLSYIIRYIFTNDCLQFATMDDVEILCKKYHMTLADFDVEKNNNLLYESTVKKYLGYYYNGPDDMWMQYLKIKMTITEEENSMYFKHISSLFKEKETKKITTFDYQKFMSLHAGQYFGDFALDNLNKKRNATIRAEEDCYLGVISNKIYEEYIMAEKQKIKIKEIAFLNEFFFFKTIKPTNFEKLYFENFAPYNYTRGHQIYLEGHKASKLVLVKEGLVEISFNGSLLDLHNVIKILITKILEFYSTHTDFPRIENSDLNYFKEFLIDEKFSNLKFKSKKYIEEINSKKKILVSIISGKDVCGLEEIFLGNINRILRATVHSEFASIYKIDVERMKDILKSEFGCIRPYFTFSNAKIMSLIKRLCHVKQTLSQINFNESKIIEKDIDKSNNLDTILNCSLEGIKIISFSLSNKYFDVRNKMSINIKSKKARFLKKDIMNSSSNNDEQITDNKNNKIINTEISTYSTLEKKNLFSKINLKNLNTDNNILYTSNNYLNSSMSYDKLKAYHQKAFRKPPIKHFNKLVLNKENEYFDGVNSKNNNKETVKEELKYDSYRLEKFKSTFNSFFNNNQKINSRSIVIKEIKEKNVFTDKNELKVFITEDATSDYRTEGQSSAILGSQSKIKLNDTNKKHICRHNLSTDETYLSKENLPITKTQIDKVSISVNSLNLNTKKSILKSRKKLPSIGKPKSISLNTLKKIKDNNFTNGNIQNVIKLFNDHNHKKNKLNYSEKCVKDYYSKNNKVINKLTSHKSETEN